MAMSEDLDSNLKSAELHMSQAAKNGAEIVIFPELMLSPFFPQHEKKDASGYLLEIDHPAVKKLQETSGNLGIISMLNIYLSEKGKAYDASLVIDQGGDILGISKMVHIVQTPQFYEQDYYAPSDTSFMVYETDFGRIGVVICFDRHFPESIRSCALQGADLIIIPTANTFGEPLELFDWEIRVAAYQNGVFVAMANRVGKEANMDFCGGSIIVGPTGNMVAKAGNDVEILYGEFDPEEKKEALGQKTFLKLRRPGKFTG